MIPRGLQAFLGRLGLHKPWQAISVAVIGVAALWGVFRWATAPDFVPVMTAAPLEDVSAAMQRLDEDGIDYEISRSGRDVLVPANDLSGARVALAEAGLQSAGRPGFELFDQPSWGMTDFTQRINYRRAMEGELGRTIGELRGIADARVHLTLHETSPFRRASRPAEASVVLSLASSMPPDEATVRGIAMLVASSVDGLVSDNVTIVDDEGHMLSAAVEPGSLAGVTSRQLEMRQELERYLERKTVDLVGSVVGFENAQVRVAALINFDQVTRETKTLDPDGQVVTSETKQEAVPGEADDQGVTESTTQVAFDTPTTVESFIGGAGQVDRLTVSVLLNDRRNEDGTPAPRTPAEIQQIEGLVRNAVGLDETRGDAITVVSIPFEPVPLVPIDAPGPGIFDRIQTLYRPVLGALGLLLMFMIALRTLKLVSQANEDRRALDSRAAPAIGPAVDPSTGDASLAQRSAMPQAPVLEASNRDRAIRVARDRPEAAARQLRAWMQEG